MADVTNRQDNDTTPGARNAVLCCGEKPVGVADKPLTRRQIARLRALLPAGCDNSPPDRR